jgi:hypothetical protein
VDSIQNANPGLASTSAAAIPLYEKLREMIAIFVARLSGIFKAGPAEGSLFDIAEYESLLNKYSGRNLTGAAAFEIGYGPRPNRLFATTSCGVDVTGTDIDVPLLRCTPRNISTIIHRNGPERALKTAVRFMLFDRIERGRLDKALRKRGFRLKIEPHRLRVGDAATFNIAPQSLDFIYSEDVFEHVLIASVYELVPKMATWLKPDGLAFIRPHVFTGIAGGHLLEWYPSTVNDPHPRKSEPWEHLRKRRFKANTYLNELCLADYRKLFQQDFEILEEKVRQPDLGRQYLTPEIAAELSQWSDEELFSNRILFVLRPLPR